MEALTSLGIDWKLLIAQIVNFLVLLVLLWKFLYNPLVKMLAERKKKIEQGLKDAEDARAQLEQTKNETRRLIATATSESEKIVKSAKQEMELETKHKLDETQKRAEEILTSAKKQAQDEQKKIVDKAKKEISDLAIQISEKILGEETDKDKASKAIKEL